MGVDAGAETEISLHYIVTLRALRSANCLPFLAPIFWVHSKLTSMSQRIQRRHGPRLGGWSNKW